MLSMYDKEAYCVRQRRIDETLMTSTIRWRVEAPTERSTLPGSLRDQRLMVTHFQQAYTVQRKNTCLCGVLCRNR